MADRSEPTYPGGLDALLARHDQRRAPLVYETGEALPPLDVALAPLREKRVLPLDLDPNESPTACSSYALKRRGLRREFMGAPELCFLNGLLISNLRKRDFPDHTPALFQRLWAEEGGFLLQRLNARWLISAATTFGDHGVNEAQRGAGQALTILFGMMKLYETERLYAGQHPAEHNDPSHPRQEALPLEMDSYALINGGLDVSMLSSIWSTAKRDTVIAPLAAHLLDLLNTDKRNIFSRLDSMAQARKTTHMSRNENAIPVPATPAVTRHAPTWGVMATAKGSIRAAAEFAAHHIDQGASYVHLCFDPPRPDAEQWLRHPLVRVVQSEVESQPEDRQKKLARFHSRQTYHFDAAYQVAPVDWIAHLDVDEFLLAGRPIDQSLRDIASSDAFGFIQVAEQLTGSDAQQYFHRPADSTFPAHLRRRVFPVFGRYIPTLILSAPEPRYFVRTGLSDIKCNKFTLRYRKKEATNGTDIPALYVGHRHANGFEHFLQELPRRSKTSYRRRNADGYCLADILDILQMEPNPKEALEKFFQEISTARPEVLSAFEETGLLLTTHFRPSETRVRYFPEIS